MPKKSVAVQTSPGHFPSPTEVCQSLVRDIKPEHFTKVQISKLEDVFRLRTKPDEIKMQILAMESNLLFKDVEAWFKERRLKWLLDADKIDMISISESSDEILPDVQC